ncbi:MAG: 4'-phosphopantetheinyl transferase family protein [Acidimicrobiales bacterium]
MDRALLQPEGSIDVVWLDLDQPLEVVEELALLLDPDEEQRVARLAHPLERSRATVRLARRRQVLADIFSLEPDQVDARPRANGQPRAVSSTGESLFISSSHCEDVGLIAVARDRKVGVDVEAAHELPEPDQFAQWVAAVEELHEINELAVTDRAAACLRLWTRKEAYSKATGEGIGDGMHRVRVPLDPDPWAQPFDPLSNGLAWLLFELPSPRIGLNASLVTARHERSDPQVIVTRR